MKLYIVIQNCGYVSHLNYRMFTDKIRSLAYHDLLKASHIDVIKSLQNDGVHDDDINLNETKTDTLYQLSYDDQEVCSQLTWEELEISQDNSDIIVNLKNALSYMSDNTEDNRIARKLVYDTIKKLGE